MPLNFVTPESVRAHPMYTPIVSVSGPSVLHYFAGTCAVDRDGQCVGEGDMLAQFRFVMTVLTTKLEAIGASWSDVVFRRIFTTDVDACLTAERDQQVLSYTQEGRRPASSLIGVTRLANPKFLIEIELVVATAP